MRQIFYNRPAGGRRPKPYAGGAGRTNRTTVGNADYTIKAWDRVVALTATPTVNRTWTLPAASSVPAGKSILLIDQSGGGIVVGGAFIVLAAAGFDMINIGEATLDLETPNFVVQVISNGTNKWVASLSTFEEVTDLIVHRFLDVSNNASFGGDVSIIGTTGAGVINSNGILTCSASIRQTGASEPLGYHTGAGGTVTQLTSKSTAVTINKPVGRITTHNAALAAGASVVFRVNNSVMTSTDLVLVNSLNANYRCEIADLSTGLFDIRITNLTAVSLSQAVTIAFAIINGATT